MSYKFVYRPLAELDITDAYDYYKNINPRLAKQFMFRIRESLYYITLTPVGFQIKYNGVRTLLLKQFPYHIHYIVDEAKQQIVILAIIHAYRNLQDYSVR